MRSRAPKNPKRLAALSALVAVLAVSGLAAAQENDVAEETLFNFGYDEDLHLLVWGTAETDGDHDCTLANGALGVEYLTTEDAITVNTLSTEPGGEEPVVFPDLTGSGEDLEYFADGECALQAAEVRGPNGQINHGQLMKLWNSIYEGPRRGCINRSLAGSELGKGDQQVKVDDVDPDFESVADAEPGDVFEGEVTFTTALADCEHQESGVNGNTNASPKAGFNRQESPRANPEGGSRGRSADAPGHKKG